MAEPRPRGARVLVKMLDDREEPSGIVIPDGISSGSPSRGTVTHVGPGYYTADGTFVEMDLRPGDEVLFFKGRGVQVALNGEALLLLKDDDVLVVTDPASVVGQRVEDE